MLFVIIPIHQIFQPPKTTSTLASVQIMAVVFSIDSWTHPSSTESLGA